MARLPAPAAALAAIALLCAPTAATARPFTVEDLLQEESFGDSVLDPTGRWLVIERRDALNSAARYDYNRENAAAVSRLLLADLDHPGPARPLLRRRDNGPGDQIAGFSPDGARLAITRLRGDALTLGVVTVATGAVRWFPVTPEYSDFGRSLQWVSNRALAVIARPDRSQPWRLRMGHVARDTLPGRWRAKATGAGGWTVLGSGAFRDVRARRSPDDLLRIDTATGAVRRLARGGWVDLEVSPDRRRIALLSAGPDLQPQAGQPLQGDWGVATQQQTLSLLDLVTGRLTAPCPGCDLLPHGLHWSPDGAALLIYARGPGEPWRAGRLRRLDVRSGRIAQIGQGIRPVIEGRPELIRTGWMGDAPVVLARPASDPAARPDWVRLGASGPVILTAGLPAAPRTLVALSPEGLSAVAGGRLWRVSPDGAAAAVEAPCREGGWVRPLGVDKRPAVQAPSAPWPACGAAGAVRPTPLGPDGHPTPLDIRLGEAPVVAASRRAGAVVVRTADGRGVEQLQVLRPGRGPLTIATVNTRLADLDALAAHPVHHLGPGGQALTSWLFTPPPRADGRPPPLVVRAYAGEVNRTPPRDSLGATATVTNLHMLVGHGYAVLVPSLPQPPGAEPSEGLADRILGIVEAAAADPALSGAFDPDRLALWGHSFGAHTVMAVIGQTHRFRAAVSLAGTSDLIDRWGAFSPPYEDAPEEGVYTPWSAGWTESLQGAMGAPPWAAPERYRRNSPMMAADRITTPLLQIRGDQDTAPLGQTEGMFSALYRQDKDALLVTYWGEGHLITSPGNIRDLWDRAFRFLDGALAVRPAPAARSGNPEPGPASAAPRPRSSPH